MKKLIQLVFPLLFLLLLAACQTAPTASPSTDPNTLVADCDVKQTLSKTFHPEKMSQFFQDYNNGKPSKIKIASSTIEGDPIFKTIEFNGREILYTVDNTYDKYGGKDKGVTTNTFTKLILEEKQTEKVYVLLDEKGNKVPVFFIKK